MTGHSPKTMNHFAKIDALLSELDVLAAQCHLLDPSEGNVANVRFMNLRATRHFLELGSGSRAALAREAVEHCRDAETVLAQGSTHFRDRESESVGEG